MYKATISTGTTKNPIIKVKPTQYRKNEQTPLILSVVLTYHPDITEAGNVHYQDYHTTKLFFWSESYRLC